MIRNVFWLLILASLICTVIGVIVARRANSTRQEVHDSYMLDEIDYQEVIESRSAFDRGMTKAQTWFFVGVLLSLVAGITTFA